MKKMFRIAERGSDPARAVLLISLAAIFLAGTGAGAQSAEQGAPEPRPGDEVGWHTVRPGETLEGITGRYLGTRALWRENWRLNPRVEDPDFLRPGERLRVILRRELPPRSAEVVRVARRVEAKPQPNPWTAAQEGDLLREEDGVRTYTRSSAELGFDDGSRLQLTEESIVFLKRLGTSLTGVRQGTIEIVEGQADLAARLERPGAADIEILVGGAAARPRPDAEGLAESRARRGNDGGAQLMVYRGGSRLEAGGARVEVPSGMGTSVPEGGAPRPPEKLLPAPAPSSPAAGSRWDYANPPFAWEAVEGAASYVVEVCRDSGCGALVERATGVTGTSWQAPSLPVEDLHWRVTAVSASGLDGFPAPAVPFAVLSERADTAPPVVVVAVVGAGSAPGGRDEVLLGAVGALTLSAHDDLSGVAGVSYRWNGGDWLSWEGAPLTPPGAGEHLLEARATDRVGHISEVWGLGVRVDAEPPAPPGVR